MDASVNQEHERSALEQAATRDKRRRGRARAERDGRRVPARTRRAPATRSKPERVDAAEEREERANLDDLYLSEMAERSVLTPEEEVEIGVRIARAERAILEGIARSKSGARSLSALAEELTDGRTDVRELLLNPDQEGIDLGSLRGVVASALARSRPGDPQAASEVADVLGAVRIDTGVVADLVSSVRSAAVAEGDPEDVTALELIDRARRELKREKERLVVGNLRLVVLFARKYLGRGVPLLDLVQEGNLGLMRAADKFDHRRGFRFSTYASWWIKQALQRALLDRTLRLPVHVADDRRRVSRIRAAFLAQHRREPTAEEIASRAGLVRERVESILSLPPQPSSLDAPIGEEGDGRLIDLLPSPLERPDETVAHQALSMQLGDLLDVLSPREQEVVRMRFGIGRAREHTLEEVGRELALTRERIRQIERAALAKLKARSERVELRSYLEG